MIIRLKRKTFSVDPNQMTNQELVNSATDNKKYKRNNTIGYGLAGAGLGLAGGAAAGLGIATQSKKYKQAKSLVNKAVEGPYARVKKNNWWATSIPGAKSTNRLSKIVKTKHSIASKGLFRGAAVGTAIGATALGTAGYLRGRRKSEKREAERAALLNRMNQSSSAGY